MKIYFYVQILLATVGIFLKYAHLGSRFSKVKKQKQPRVRLRARTWRLICS